MDTYRKFGFHAVDYCEEKRSTCKDYNMHISLSEARTPELTRANDLRHFYWKCRMLASMKTNSSSYVSEENLPIHLALGVCCRSIEIRKFGADISIILYVQICFQSIATCLKSNMFDQLALLRPRDRLVETPWARARTIESWHRSSYCKNLKAWMLAAEFLRREMPVPIISPRLKSG